MSDAKDEVNYLRKTKGLFGLLFLSFLIFTGCGSDKGGTVITGAHYHQPETESKETGTESEEQTETEGIEETEGLEPESTMGTDLYMIISNDMKMEHMILEQLASGRQYMYYYSLTTRFLDKYDDRTTILEFEPGRIVNIGERDSEGKLLEIKISDAVWEYEEITRYAVDEERGIFKIADINYSYDDDLYVVSNGEKIQLSSLTEMDEIRVVGVDKEILSVAVTTGHGELALENTALFEGSYVQIGDEIFAEITSNMKLEIPEGNYLVAVANKGYGGSKEVTIERGQTTTLNLDDLKGEGPKKGKILFAVDTDNAELWVDGEKKDYTDAIEMQYGIHTIKVSAPGYDDYRKKLFVNSKEATILVEMTGGTGNATANSEKESEKDSESSSENSSENSSETTNTDTNNGNTAGAGSMAGSLAGGSAGTNGAAANTNTGTTNSATDSAAQTNNALENSSDDLEDEVAADYLSTLSELLKTLSD